jgi:hypothetical protein
MGAARPCRRAGAGRHAADPKVLAIRAAVRDKPEEAIRLTKARVGMINRDEFFNPENIQRLLNDLQAGV